MKGTPRRILFLRRLRVFRGAHLTAWNYFHHLLSSPSYDPYVWLSDDSSRDARNPFMSLRERVVRRWRAKDYDGLVVGGRDWQYLAPRERERPPVPVCHLVLHVRRADPNDTAFEFLRHPAIRICATPDVAERVRACGAVNGPVFVNSHGLDPDVVAPARPYASRPLDVLVAGVKQPELARRVAARLVSAAPGRRIEALVERVPRGAFLAAMASARIVVHLPNPTEGFFRPALESMALRSLVVCPRFDGNSQTCRDRVNCLVPEYGEDAIVSAAAEALAMPAAARDELVAAAHADAGSRTLDDERRGLLDILERAAEAGLWPRYERRLAV